MVGRVEGKVPEWPGERDRSAATPSEWPKGVTKSHSRPHVSNDNPVRHEVARCERARRKEGRQMTSTA
jgi:hypothetical protein